MQTIKLTGIVDENKQLSLTVPPEVPMGKVEVIVLVDEPESESKLKPDRPGVEALAELKAFHKGRRLDGISLKELIEDGRR